MVIGLGIILLGVLVLPFISKTVEGNLELFLFIMGLAASLISRAWIVSGHFNADLLIKVLKSPVLITLAVFISGMLFKVFQQHMTTAINSVLRAIPIRVFIFLVVLILGLASSFITAIIAALILVEIVNVLGLERKQEIALDILACFSIGLGATMTPAGEPLAAIAISKLAADFWHLSRVLGIYIIPGIVILSGFACLYIKPEQNENTLSSAREAETYGNVVMRALKVFLFVMALELLGEGFKPLIDLYVLGLSGRVLYWLNMVSAILDNATLTAAEISIKMNGIQIKGILLGLLISGGMLIPGNIPNIISANKLKITSREWARLGMPLGLVMMLTYYVILFVV